MNVLDQSVLPFYRGEDPTFVLRGSTQNDPTSWAVKLTVIPNSGTTAFVSSPTITRVVTGTSAPFICTFTAVIPAASTLLFVAGVAAFQFERTDVGAKTILGAGSVEVMEPPTPIS